MIVYNGTSSRAKFHDTERTPVSTRPRPVVVLQRPQADAKRDNRVVLPVQCALTNAETDSRNAVRHLLVGRISECFEVPRITADMRKNQWQKPGAKRVRTRTVVHDV